ncbi:alanyl-tRNA editing protein [Holzapfeliella sp. He02]|uniref:Alanyl-tRNA editing protein n=1 Tax=Holzapfeliella saturejae TaxID=3082953 RepID=A0ABU8SGL9_9LACO
MEQYLIDSYKTEHQTSITSISEDRQKITVKDTIIYPGGGGQPSDKAWVEADGQHYDITGFSRQNGQVVYHLSEPIPAETTTITEYIDFDYRFRNMRYHTLLHLVSGYLYNTYGALAKSSAIEADHARLEVQFPEDRVPENFDKEAFKATIDNLINQGLAVTSEEVDRTELSQEDLIRTYTSLIPESVRHVRLVKIEGLDEQACGGTHVSNTREIDQFEFTQLKNKGRLKKRIKMALN